MNKLSKQSIKFKDMKYLLNKIFLLHEIPEGCLMNLHNGIEIFTFLSYVTPK